MNDKGEQPLITDFKRGIQLLLIVEEISKKNFAHTTGIAEAYLTRFLNNSSGLNPTLETLTKLALGFDMYIEDVVRFARACDVSKLQLIVGGQDQVIKDLLCMREVKS